jgi:hypothetical protein
MKKLQIFDFDETLFRVPGFASIAFAEFQYNTGKRFLQKPALPKKKFNTPYEFFDDPISLDTTIYKIQLIKPVYDAWKKGNDDPNCYQVLITHRSRNTREAVEKILDLNNISFDNMFFLGRTKNKAEVVNRLFNIGYLKNEKLYDVEIYEDSIYQIQSYQANLNCCNPTFYNEKARTSFFIVDKSKMFRIYKVNISDQKRIELI